MTQSDLTQISSFFESGLFEEAGDLCLRVMLSHPEQGESIFHLMRQGLQISPREEDALFYTNFLSKCYEAVAVRVTQHPEEALSASVLMRDALASDQNDEVSLAAFFESLIPILSTPSVPMDVFFPLVGQAFHCPGHTRKSLYAALNFIDKAMTSQALRPLVTQYTHQLVAFNDPYVLFWFYKKVFKWMQTYPDCTQEMRQVLEKTLQAPSSLHAHELELLCLEIFTPLGGHPVLKTLLPALAAHPAHNDRTLDLLMTSCQKAFIASPEEQSVFLQAAASAVCHKNASAKTLTQFLALIFKGAHKNKELRKYLADVLFETGLKTRSFLKEDSAAFSIDTDTFALFVKRFKQLRFQTDISEEKMKQMPLLLRVVSHCRFLNEEEARYVAAHLSPFEIVRMSMAIPQRVLHTLVDMLWHEKGGVGKISPGLRQHTKDIRLEKYYQPAWMVPAAFTIARIFGPYFDWYLKRLSEAFTTRECVSFLPEGLSLQSAQDFGRFLHNRLKTMPMIPKNIEQSRHILFQFETVGRVWCELSAAQRKASCHEIWTSCLSKTYTGRRSEAFAKEAYQWHVSRNDYLEYETYYLAGLKTPEPFDSTRRFQRQNFCGRFLPRSDVRSGFFGEYTSCCQHYNGNGADPAISSVKDAFAQLFVIEDRSGRIVAGSWVWRTLVPGPKKEENTWFRGACFDSLECLKQYADHNEILEIFQAAADDLARTEGYYLVTCGKSFAGLVPAYPYPVPVKHRLSLPRSYNGSYTDAKMNQYLLAWNDSPKAVSPQEDHKLFVRPYTLDDGWLGMRIARLHQANEIQAYVCVSEARGAIGFMACHDKSDTVQMHAATTPDETAAEIYQMFLSVLREKSEEDGHFDYTLLEPDAVLKKVLAQPEFRGNASWKQQGAQELWTLDFSAPIVSLVQHKERPSFLQFNQKTRA